MKLIEIHLPIHVPDGDYCDNCIELDTSKEKPSCQVALGIPKRVSGRHRKPGYCMSLVKKAKEGNDED